MYNWAVTCQNQQNEFAPSEDSDQPGHPPCLIRVFAVCMKKHWVFSYTLSAQQKLWSDWADAQAAIESSLGTHSFCWFCHVAAQLYNVHVYSSKVAMLHPIQGPFFHDSKHLYMNSHWICAHFAQFSLRLCTQEMVQPEPNLKYPGTPEPLYNTVCYYTVLDITRIRVGPQIAI